MPTNFLSQLTGSFATSAAQNPTVAVMEAAYAAAGLDVRYINCEVPPERLQDAVRGAIGMGWLGFNCSIPHKVAILDLLDALAPSAEIIGAVNCVIIDGERLTGENTDGQGFVNALRTVKDPAGRSFAILGAGGAARAIAVEAALAGAERITIVTRTATRGRELAELVSARTPAAADFVEWTETYAVPADVDVLVNATSIGFHPSTETPDVAGFRPGLVVADVVANPPQTEFLQQASAAGSRTLEGLGMLVNQALTNARLWTGRELDAAVMRRALEDSLAD
ncbi:MAG: shikimate dehydrogenase family protein [bacterium]